MSEQSPASREPRSDEWPDDLPAAPGRQPGPGGPQRWIRPVILVVIVLAAALAGAGIVLAAHDLSEPASNAAAAGGQPSYLAPWPPGGGQAILPGDRTGATAEIFLTGRVTALSSTSITIGAPGHSITAAVTTVTRVTGTVSSISGIRVGDRVSAQITQRAGRYTAAAIQDPAGSLSGITTQ